ncbi:hypothetical protein NUACC21_60840 [Scytonema sp. NUACC21]
MGNSSPLITDSKVSQIEQGKQLYDAGRYAEAAQVWEQAASVFAQRRDFSNQAKSYNYLAIVYQDLGMWDASQKALNKAFNLLKKIKDSFVYAQALNTLGNLQFKIGQIERALETWKLTEARYRSIQDLTGIILSKINQAQALQTLGLYRRSRTTLEQVNQDLAVLPDSLLKARGLYSLGVTLQVIGELQLSQTVLSESLAIAKKLNSPSDIGETLFRLGNTAKARADFETALNLYQQAKDTATSPHTQLEAQLNQLSILIKIKQIKSALALLPQIQSNIANMPASRAVVYAQVNFAKNLMDLSSVIKGWFLESDEKNQTNDTGQMTLDIARLLTKAVGQARDLKDSRAESYALGELGHLYEQRQQWSEALALTQQAISIAQGTGATDITPTWYWQQGRILKAQENITEAIAVYNQAVDKLQSLRQDLVGVNSEVQFSFRDRVEPVYRQLVQLLLQTANSLPETTKQKHLQRSRELIETLQIAELDNFFREACLTYKSKPIEQIDRKAAVIYPIVLDQRLEVVLSLPGQPLQHYGTPLSQEEATKVFEELRQYLNPVFLPSEILPTAQKVYNWLLRPVQAELERQEIKTLVFVLDGFLRNVPMSVLHDGKQYLVEKYDIALTPGLQLLESPSSFKQASLTLSLQKLKTLAAGLTEARQGFSALPGVETEIQRILNKFSAKVLLNRDFTRSNLQKRVETTPFSIVHLATHGQFSSKAEDTFLLTWDDRIQVKDLDRLLKIRDEQKPIELLVLSACQTAKGDNRAALGLAGVAVRSGARSTLATLWSVQDKSTAQLISEFYRILTQKKVTKAEALRQAQVSLLHSSQYKHPYYWSPFVLVGNWL